MKPHRALAHVTERLETERHIVLAPEAKKQLEEALVRGYRRAKQDGRREDYDSAVERLTAELMKQVPVSNTPPALPRPERSRWGSPTESAYGKHRMPPKDLGFGRSKEKDRVGAQDVDTLLSRLCPGFWPFC